MNSCGQADSRIPSAFGLRVSLCGGPMAKTAWTGAMLIPSMAMRPAASIVYSDVPTAPRQANNQTQDNTPIRLTADEAVRLGLQRNPQIAAGTAGVASANATYRSLSAFPSVQLGVTHAQGTSTAPTLT